MPTAGPAVEASIIHSGFGREHWPDTPLRAASAQVELLRRRRANPQSDRSLLHLGTVP